MNMNMNWECFLMGFAAGSATVSVTILIALSYVIEIDRNDKDSKQRV